jgi:propionyl-CoA synthetase
MMDVPAGYRESIERPGQFWMRAAQSISWYVAPTQAFAAGKHGLLQWYPGASLNTCFNAVDRHVLAGRGNQPALIYDSPVTAAVRRFSFVELKREVERLAGARFRLKA